MSSASEDAARDFQRLLGQLSRCDRATTRAERMRELVAASERQAAAAPDGTAAADDALPHRTAVLDALAEVEAARAAHRPRRPAHTPVEDAAKEILDHLASRVTRNADRPRLMRTQLHPALARALGPDVAQIVLVIAAALPSPPHKPDAGQAQGTLF